MLQPGLNGEKTWLVVLLAILALSSFGFAILGLVLGPELTLELEQQRQRTPESVARPAVPDLEQVAKFWDQTGYLLTQREQSYEIQRQQSKEQVMTWVQGQERWVLVPTRYDLHLGPALLELCGGFLEQGWLIQLEATSHGYTIGFWSSVPESEHKVLAYFWHLELLNPHNYGTHAMDHISVLGEPFDPEGFLRGTPQAPVLAMIIDDWGYITTAIDPLVAYPFPLTIAVLPHLILSQEVSARAHQAGHEVILHQPMEALNSGLDLGPGGITVGMDPEEIAIQLKDNLASLPVAVGLNNHMGSRATEDPGTMVQVLQVVKELDLFFVDSRTSNFSVVAEVARDVGVPYGVNNLFIDNESDVEKIKEQVRKGLALAEKQGHAVVIGHVRPATAVALWEMVPELLASGVKFVPASQLLQSP